MFRVLVPFVHVQSVSRSIEFYGKLGFRVGNTFTPDGAPGPSWAWLETEYRAQLMLAKAGEPVIASQQAVPFYTYCDDVGATRARLEKAGMAAGPIQFPFYAPRGEFRIEDPDGYVLMVTHT